MKVPGEWYGFSKLSLLWNMRVKTDNVLPKPSKLWQIKPCEAAKEKMRLNEQYLGEKPKDFRWALYAYPQS